MTFDDRSLDIAVIGLGQGGGNLAAQFAQFGYRAIALNTALTDLSALGDGRSSGPFQRSACAAGAAAELRRDDVYRRIRLRRSHDLRSRLRAASQTSSERRNGEIHRAGKLIMGVCNGFQIMVKLGLLPGLDGDYFTQKVSLIQNDCGTFQNFWVHLRFESGSPCVFTRGLNSVPLPIRHGEGKLFTLDKELLRRLESAGCVPCRYANPETGEATQKFPHNPNGSLNAIAGLCDPSGRVFGPDAAPGGVPVSGKPSAVGDSRQNGLLPEHGLGLALFRNAVEHLKTI